MKQGPIKEALVCWLGYDGSFDLWEPVSALEHENEYKAEEALSIGMSRG